MKAFIGLGNPGRKYRGTRHNVGAALVERFAEDNSIKLRKHLSGTHTGWFERGSGRVLLAIPGTYMNSSGSAVLPLVRRSAIPLEDLFIIHDDLDLPIGTVRVKFGGGNGGHRGLGSTIDFLGYGEFGRIRMGIGRPPEGMDSADYVLGRFGREEEEGLGLMLERGILAIETIITDGMAAAMNLLNKKQD